MNGYEPGWREVRSGDTATDAQAQLLARDLGRLDALRRAYERLLPAGLDPASPAPPAPVIRTATVLFTDLRQFTGLAERLAADPARLLEVVNVHLAAILPAITWAGGVVEKFTGDGLLATFGARTELAEHQERAAGAALGVIATNAALNAERAQAWGFQLEVGVAVASGPLVLGALGSAERWELGVLGDPVNVAARLVQAARSGEVLLAASTYERLRGLPAELVGGLAVRGRQEQVEVYRLRPGVRAYRTLGDPAHGEMASSATAPRAPG